MARFSLAILKKKMFNNQCSIFNIQWASRKGELNDYIFWSLRL